MNRAMNGVMKHFMKKTARTVAGASTLTVVGTAAVLHAMPATAWAALDAAAAPLSAMPGAEALMLGLIGLCSLGLARQRASM